MLSKYKIDSIYFLVYKLVLFYCLLFSSFSFAATATSSFFTSNSTGVHSSAKGAIHAEKFGNCGFFRFFRSHWVNSNCSFSNIKCSLTLTCRGAPLNQDRTIGCSLWRSKPNVKQSLHRSACCRFQLESSPREKLEAPFE